MTNLESLKNILPDIKILVLDEATSLILGKNPNEVTLDQLVKMFENIFINILHLSLYTP